MRGVMGPPDICKRLQQISRFLEPLSTLSQEPVLEFSAIVCYNALMALSRRTAVTQKQVAELAGVHFSTVSRALNPATRAQVKPQIAARVLQTAEQLGYRANALAS